MRELLIQSVALVDEPLIKIVISIFVFILGAVVGSFSNVLIYRLPEKMSIVKPGSHCFNCGTPIKWYDNIPILSWLILGGKCRHCKAKISPQYFLVELFTAIMYVLTYLYFGLSVSTFLLCLIETALIVISFIDYKTYEISDSMLILMLACAIPMFFLKENLMESTYAEKLIGAGSVLLIYLIILIISRIIKKPLLGFGDVKLLIVMALIINYKVMILVIILASILALIVEIVIKRKKKEIIPFGPYLAAAFIIAMFFGNMLINFYLSLF